MSFCNSVTYVQQQIDNILRLLRAFVRAYIDDIVIFSRTLDDHLSHLYQLFSLLSQYNIVINPKKAYIGFPTIRLLGQKVSSLGLSTTQDKIDAIAKLDFPKNLKDLETYLGLTGWLRQYVPYYAYIAEP